MNSKMTVEAKLIIKELQALGKPSVAKQMSYFALPVEKAFGINTPVLRKFAKKLGKNHELAISLFKSGYHEARVLAALIADQSKFNEELMDEWTHQFDNWGVCDCCCGEVFTDTPYAFDKAIEWSKSEKEFVKRAGFALMAELAMHDKKAKDQKFIPFFRRVETEAYDERNFVKKAVNWALRQIGKRNSALHEKAIASANKIKLQPHRSAKWIAADALRELNNEKIIERINKKSSKFKVQGFKAC